MKFLFANLAMAATLLSAPAFAADMAVKAPVAPAPAVDAWAGFYVGGNVGYEWLHSAAYRLAPDANTSLFLGLTGTVLPGALSGQGAEGGGQVGYNWRVQNWVLGVEADIQASDAVAKASAQSASGVGPNFVQSAAGLDWFGTARLRAGWLFTPSTLAYATGGFAYGRTFRTFNGLEGVGGCGAIAGPAGCAFGGSVTHNNSGWAVGGGLEQLVPNTKISLGVEYLYVQLGGNSFNTACTNPECAAPPASGQALVTAGKLDTQIIRAKLNLHF